jgi:hypothetical protein
VAGQFDFGANENKHFSSLAKYCIISALALVFYAIANASFILNVVASGKAGLILRCLDDAFLVVAALFSAYQLQGASKCFNKIVKTQGNDLALLNLSNQKLRSVFASIAIMLILLAVRFVLDFPVLMLWIKTS